MPLRLVKTDLYVPPVSLDAAGRVLARVEGSARISSRSWVAACPVCNVEEYTLHVTQRKDGRLHLRCATGCALHDLTTVLNVEPADIWGLSLDEEAALDAGADAPKDDPLTRDRWRLDELLANPAVMVPPAAVVPRLAWQGRSTLLACEEKGGKSTLCGYATAKVSRGDRFLGAGVIDGVVLVVSLEEHFTDTARRFAEFGAAGDRVYLVTTLPSEPEARQRALRQHIADTSPVLVIVDTLMAYAAGMVSDANSSTQMQAVVQALTNLAHETGVAIILTHHAKKNGGGYRDSSAIGGAIDVIAEMSIPEPDDDPALRHFRMRGRVPVTNFDLRYFPVYGGGHDYELAIPGETEAPIERRVWEFVAAHPVCSLRDIREAVTGRNERIDAAVGALVMAGRIAKTGKTVGTARFTAVPSHTVESEQIEHDTT